MKPSNGYEFLACVLGLLGALALGCALFPCLNPIQFKFHFGDKGVSPVTYMILGLPAAILTLSAALYFNNKAKRLKSEEQEEAKRRTGEPPTSAGSN